MSRMTKISCALLLLAVWPALFLAAEPSLPMLLIPAEGVLEGEDEDSGPTLKEIRKLVQQAAMAGDASALAEVLRSVG